MFHLYLETPDGSSLKLSESRIDLASAVMEADYAYRTAAQLNCHVSVWRSGKVYYSTDRKVKLDGLEDKQE
jgi:hypothetical protein